MEFISEHSWNFSWGGSRVEKIKIELFKMWYGYKQNI